MSKHLEGKNEGINQVAEILRGTAFDLEQRGVQTVSVDDLREIASILQRHGPHTTSSTTTVAIVRTLLSQQPAPASPRAGVRSALGNDIGFGPR